MPSKLNGFLLLLMLLNACSNNKSEKAAIQIDSSITTTDTISTVTIDTPLNNQAILSFARDSILPLMAANNYTQLARFISDEGIVFLPYGMADTSQKKVVSRNQYLQLIKNNTKVLWGHADGTGDPIRLTIPQYFKKFVYDVGFIKAQQTSVNKVIDPDSSMSKVPAVYAGQPYVQFYFPGFNKDYEGMDWKSLLLVFKEEQSTYYLVAVIHNQWKI